MLGTNCWILSTRSPRQTALVSHNITQGIDICVAGGKNLAIGITVRALPAENAACRIRTGHVLAGSRVVRTNALKDRSYVSFGDSLATQLDQQVNYRLLPRVDQVLIINHQPAAPGSSVQLSPLELTYRLHQVGVVAAVVEADESPLHNESLD